MEPIGKIINKTRPNRDHRNTYEYQAYGNWLAEELNDRSHRSLYIKLAKTKDRKYLDLAREFVIGQEHITEKGRLFMWKLKQLEEKAKLEDKGKKN